MTDPAPTFVSAGVCQCAEEKHPECDNCDGAPDGGHTFDRWCSQRDPDEEPEHAQHCPEQCAKALAEKAEVIASMQRGWDSLNARLIAEVERRQHAEALLKVTEAGYERLLGWSKKANAELAKLLEATR